MSGICNKSRRTDMDGRRGGAAEHPAGARDKGKCAGAAEHAATSSVGTTGCLAFSNIGTQNIGTSVSLAEHLRELPGKQPTDLGSKKCSPNCSQTANPTDSWEFF